MGPESRPAISRPLPGGRIVSSVALGASNCEPAPTIQRSSTGDSFLGPAPLSFRDAVAFYEHVLGKSIPARSMNPGEPAPSPPEAVWNLAASFDTFDSPVDMTEMARVFGVVR